MAVLVIIGDLVASRTLRDRQRVQTRLSDALEGANDNAAGILSPYTLTLGDEFQAVLSAGSRVFRDALNIQAAVHPVLVRFSLAAGALSTDINPRQALGMDGPAFHRARAGIEALKHGDARYRVEGLEPTAAQLANASLSFISHALGKWRTRRFRILAALAGGMAVPDIARAEEISEQAVYKNIGDGRLRDVLDTFAAVGALIDRTLESAT